jgi:hypothetical protein
MKRILSEVLRRRNGVERRKGRAGALRIEFIERSRNQTLGTGTTITPANIKMLRVSKTEKGGYGLLQLPRRVIFRNETYESGGPLPRGALQHPTSGELLEPEQHCQILDIWANPFYRSGEF